LSTKFAHIGTFVFFSSINFNKFILASLSSSKFASKAAVFAWKAAVFAWKAAVSAWRAAVI
jgi:hypothetical protein